MKNERTKKKISKSIFAPWRKHIIRAAIMCGVLYFFSISTVFAAISPQVLIIDDFSDSMQARNSMKYWTDGGKPNGEEIGGLVADEDVTDPGIAGPYPACHKITYQDDLYQWWATALWDGLHADTKANILRYTHVAFEVKGAVGGEDFYVGLQETNKKKFDLQLKASDFIKNAGAGITTEWKTVRIPLNKFIEKAGNPPKQPGVNLNKVQAIDFMFYEPESLAGTIYFTNVGLEGVKIDDFEDGVDGENLLRHEYSTGESGMEPGYGDVIDDTDPEPDPDKKNKCHKLIWDTPTESGDECIRKTRLSQTI